MLPAHEAGNSLVTKFTKGQIPLHDPARELIRELVCNQLAIA